MGRDPPYPKISQVYPHKGWLYELQYMGYTWDILVMLYELQYMYMS